MKIFIVRGCRPGKVVTMTEAEIRTLCLKSREIFLSQPILLELEAPLKICGMFKKIDSYNLNFYVYKQLIITILVACSL